MFEEAVKGNIAMCEGCLAADRTLAKLGKHNHLFIKLVANLDPDVEPLMCWECISVFNKIYKFQQQVSKAQFILKYKHEFDPEFVSLSALNKSNRINYYDLEIEHKENERYGCAVVKLENIDQLINNYLNFNVDNNSDGDDKNDCNSDATFFDGDEKHAVINKDNKDDDNDINDYDDNDCKSEVNDADQSQFDFSDNDNENKEIDINNACKSEVNDGDNSCFNFGDNDNTEIDNGGSLKTKTKKKGHKPRNRFRYQYNVLEGLKDRDKLFKKVEVDKQEILDYMEKERSTNYESKLKINCELCLSKFSSEECLRQHEKMWHSKSKKWSCDICKRTFSSHSKLKHHIYKHAKYVCLLCGDTAYTRHQICKHVELTHKKLLECRKCKMRFPQKQEFYKHYTDMHMSFICDYCGEKFNTKFRVECHIRNNHTELICKKCNLTYKAHKYLMQHNRQKHSTPQPSEHTYCVECDIQFHNELQFKSHLNTSKHQQPKDRVPCTECDKTYASKYFMTCHYNLVHLKKSDFFCEKCSKETRVLTHHIRTHTGERPFSCEHCPAAFAQKIAYKIHVKSKHKETLNVMCKAN